MIGTRRSPSLAIFGGSPAFEECLYIGRPNIGDRERLLERINDLLDRKWLTNNGRYVQEFERRISDLTGAKHCIASRPLKALRPTPSALLTGSSIPGSARFRRP